MRVALWLTAVLILAGREAANSQITIAERGEARAVIVVPADASAEIRRAAGYLADTIERISDARLPVVDQPAEQAGIGRIWIGLTPEAEAQFPGEYLAFERPEEIRLLCRGQDLLIAGRDRTVAGQPVEQGTANAVYAFVRQNLGVVRLWPGALGEDLPRRETLTIAPFSHRHAPVFRQRRIYRMAYTRIPESAEFPGFRREAQQKREIASDWYRFHGVLLDSYAMQAGHAFGRWWEDYQADHPDYFALQPDGTRDAFPRPDRAKLCVSNPAVHAHWLENAERTLRARPAQLMVSASPNDSSTQGKCVCENCRAWDHPDGPTVHLRWRGQPEPAAGEDEEGNLAAGTRPGDGPHVALTDRYVRFWNILARGLRERFPDREVWVGGWAYGPYRTPPVAEVPERNLAIGFVGHFPMSGVERRENERELWRGWAARAASLVYRPNLFHYSGGMLGLPTLALRRTGEDFRFLAENSGVGLNVDSIPEHWSTQGPQYYLMARLAWDPFQDPEEIMAEYYQRGFGPAAREIAGYFALMEEVHVALLEHTPPSSGFRYQASDFIRQAYNDDVFARADAWLRAAEARAAGGPEVYRRRVAFVRTGFAFSQVQVAILNRMADLRAANGRDPDAAREAVALCARREAMFLEHRDGFALGYAQFWSYHDRRRMADYLGPPSARFRHAAGLPQEPTDRSTP